MQRPDSSSGPSKPSVGGCPFSGVSRRDALSILGATPILAGVASVAQAGPQSSAATKPDARPKPLLDAYDKIPADRRVPWLLEKINQQPLALFAELRHHRPILDTGDVVLVSRYADVIESMNHPPILSVRLYKDKMGDFLMTHDETPTHLRDKSVMAAMLPRADEPRIRELVTAHCDKAIAASGGRIEVVNGLTRSAPIHVVQTYFGLDGVDPAKLREWSFWSQSDNFHNHDFQARSNAAQIREESKRSKEELVVYAKGLIRRKLEELKANPDQDDVVSRMLKSQLPASLGFGIERVILGIMGLLIGAVETTSHATTLALDELLDRPDALAQTASFADKGDFEKVVASTWEAVRFRPMAPYLFRYCESEFTLAKGTDRATKLRPGQVILPLIQSAAFDEVEFEAPNDFRTDRPNYQNFLFGYGSHRCLGEFVGRQMIPAIIGSILKIKSLRRAAGDAGKVDFRGGPFPETLTVEFDPIA